VTILLLALLWSPPPSQPRALLLRAPGPAEEPGLVERAVGTLTVRANALSAAPPPLHPTLQPLFQSSTIGASLRLDF
jgi:hypothetical protein